MNRQALAFFETMASANTLSEQSVKLGGHSDFSDRDAAFILEKMKPDFRVLELGAGTGLIVNKIARHVKHVTAVEQFSNFTQFIEHADNVDIVHADIFSFEPSEEMRGKYDVVLCFGLMHYMNAIEAKKLYGKIAHWLHDDGIVLIKNQFGVAEDVIVSGFSEEQDTEYVAQYRTLDTEQSLLQEMKFKNIDVTDIYPPECNRWDNTHFYALTARKA